MNETIKTIEIEDFITIKLLQFKSDVWVYFVDYYNEKYFYINELEELSTHQKILPKFILKFHKVKAIYDMDIEALKNSVYDLYRQLTFKIDKAKPNTNYYFITCDFGVGELRENNYNVDNNYYKNFNYFTSKEEAIKCAKILQETLVKLRKEEYLKGE